VQTVSTYYIETKTKKMRVTVNLLQNKVDSVRRELYGEMNTAAQNQDNNLNLIRSKARVPNARTQMNIQSLSAMYAELSKNLELSKFTLMREEPLIQIIDKPILPLKKNRVGKEKGILIGFILGGLLSVLYVFGNRFKDSLLNNYTK
jgi:paraquat-inducible protein B